MSLKIRRGKNFSFSFSSYFPSVSQCSHSVMSDSLRPLRLQMPGLPVHHQLLELTQTQVYWVGDAIQPSHLLLSPSPPAFNLSQHLGLFQWVTSSHQVARVLEFQLQHQYFQWYSGLISFRMDWLDLLSVQGTLKSLLQHHSSKPSVLQGSAFFWRSKWQPSPVFVPWEFCGQRSLVGCCP